MRLARRVGVGAGLLTVVALVGFFWLSSGPEDAEGFVQLEDTAEANVLLSAAAADLFLDIRGDPMIITLPSGAQAGQRRLVLDQSIDPARAPRGAAVEVIDDLLLDNAGRVALTLPSSTADLAAFQNRRSAGLSQTRSDVESTVVDEGQTITLDADDGSWGEILGEEADGGSITYVDTVIENTTSEVLAVPSQSRAPLFRDALLRPGEEGDLATLLVDQGGLQLGEADRLTLFLERQAETGTISATQALQPEEGGLVALRTTPARFGAQILQMSIYSPDRYLLSIAQPHPGRFQIGPDPWQENQLLSRASLARDVRASRGEVRLKDAVYSSALRNGLPSNLVGELLVMLSRAIDLDRIASEDDRLRLVFSNDATGPPAARILYVSLMGPDLDFRCYVVRPDRDDAPYGCFDARSPGSGALGRGFIVPVAGAKTSGFGPRFHPVLKKMVNHTGVDWGAPTGTPVKAAAAGEISVRGPGGAYGNVIYIDHPGGVQSRYAHLDTFADGLAVGQSVRAGQLIGTVGTTGRSTGPHLHFEIRVDGVPVDPLSFGAASGSAAVEALVAQIIQVESAGNARAKNSRSTATGLGQFIDSTWLRMIRTYRPDLMERLNEDEILDLRFDPGLSRAMVTNLARENESYLRTRDHDIRPGTLYLAHFLGPAGADIALSADAGASVEETMGTQVVRANPFLDGWTVAEMIAWSDRKMEGTGSTSTLAQNTAPAGPPPPEVQRYKDAIDALVAAL